MADPTSKAEASQDLNYVVSNAVGQISQHEELQRKLKPRHVLMFSIACSIGTGLVIGSGTALARGGPASFLIAYLLVGATIFFVMTALGEMASFAPMNKGFSGYATRMVDPAFGFATGWNYFFKYVMALPTNLTASGLIVQYWAPNLNVAIWITVFAVIVIAINGMSVSKFGETEFLLGCLKVLILIVLILTTLVIALGGMPDYGRTGFRYWNTPGAFATHLLEGDTGRFLGWWACMCQACFAFTGVEVVGMTFGETPNPRKNIPRAVKQTFWRIFAFYISSAVVLGMAVPYDSDRLLGAIKQSTSAAASPFVVAMSMAGVKILPDVINGSLLVFTLSAASSDVYSASRTLYGLAKDGQAPVIFRKTRENGIPIYAIGMSFAFAALAYPNASKSASQVFQYLVSLVTIFAVLNWVAILVSYIGFRRALKAQNIPPSTQPYIGILQPYGAYYALFISVLVIIFNGYDAFIPNFQVDTFILKYVGTVIFVVNFVWWKYVKKTTWAPPMTVDLDSGRHSDAYD
ncbi:hypothetical protein Q7P37_010388 [Cladosporium fusiforme]